MHVVPRDARELGGREQICRWSLIRFSFFRSSLLLTLHRPRPGVQDTNEISGSRGEANFVWRCKNCKRESSASIKAAPTPFVAASDEEGGGRGPDKAQRIIEFDCRGLEFVEFKPEVGQNLTFL